MNSSLTKAIKILLFLFLLVASLYYARSFLVPVVFAALLSMLLLPISMKLQQIGANKAVAVIISIIALIVMLAGIIYVLYWQISDMTGRASSIETTINDKIHQLQDYIRQSFHLSATEQKSILQGQHGSITGKISALLSGVLSSVVTFVANFLLVLIYIFLFMYYRSHFEKFVLLLVPQDKQEKAKSIMENARIVAQEYITGMALMIACLWVMYSIGFSIVGIKNPIFFAILCGLLEIVPYVGNLTGSSITVLMTLAQGGSLEMAFGVAITYSIVQFVQSYIIQPLVVGRKVNLNPFFSIGGLVIGDLIWGIPGMILIIPILGITKIVCDHIEPLKPYGFLIGETQTKSKRIGIKIKKKVS